MKILITGSRTWKNSNAILEAMDTANHFIFGDCPTGADNIAWGIAIHNDLEFERFEADWKKWGSAAGPIRNQEMVDQKPDKAFAFLQSTRSKGTMDCIRRCRKSGIPVEIITK